MIKKLWATLSGFFAKKPTTTTKVNHVDLVNLENTEFYCFDNSDLSNDEIMQLAKLRWKDCFDRLQKMKIKVGPREGEKFGDIRRFMCLFMNYKLLNTIGSYTKEDNKKVKLASYTHTVKCMEEEYQDIVEHIRRLETELVRYEKDMCLAMEKAEKKKLEENAARAKKEAYERILEEEMAKARAEKLADDIEKANQKQKAEQEKFYNEWNNFLKDREPSLELFKEFLIDVKNVPAKNIENLTEEAVNFNV